MVREAFIDRRFGNNGDVEDGTVADGTNIPQFSFLKRTAADTFALSTGTGDVFAGFANTEKEASDGSTRLGAVTSFKAKVISSGAITTGQFVKTAAPGGYVIAALNSDVTSSYAILVGVACETVTDNQTMFIRSIR